MKWHLIILVILILSLAFVLGLNKINDYDIWWHLKCGELIVREGWFPRTEIFSYTVNGAPWIDGYIPAQVLLYLLWRAAGTAGICLLGAILVAGMYGLAIAISRRNGAGFGAAIAVSLPAIFLARGTMIPRPALLTPIFALLNLWLLDVHRVRGGRRIFWLIPLTILWTNCHPGFPLGPVITSIYLASYQLYIIIHKLQRGRTGGDERYNRYHELRNGILLVLIGQLVATLVNPYGHRIYFSAFSLIANSQLTKLIVEWKPLYGEPGVPVGTVPCFIVMSAIWLAAAVWAGRRTRLEHAFLFIFIMLATVYGRRNLILFGPVSIVIISWTVSEAVTGMDASRFSGFIPTARWYKIRKIFIRGGEVLIMAVSLFFIWFAGTNRMYFYLGVFRSTGIGVLPELYPQGAVELLKREKVVGNVFHPYHLGGYLIFELFPRYRVFIDGRIYPYP